MSKRCPDVFPEDWINPRIVSNDECDTKMYRGSVEVDITEDDYETLFPDGSIHFEFGFDEDGNFTGTPQYIDNGWYPHI